MVIDTVLKEKLHSVGACDRFSFAGIQFDAMAAVKESPDGGRVGASLCHHNCTTKLGAYECPAAVDNNKGIIAKSLAPAGQIVQWVTIAAAGLRLSRNRYLDDGHFDRHCEKFRIPDGVKAIYLENMRSDTVEGNEFGGDPEKHERSLTIVRDLKAAGIRVNLTSTGGRFSSTLPTDIAWVEDFMRPENQPQVFATSSDDFEPGQLESLLALAPEALMAERKRWLKLKWGQRQKACEAVAVAKFLKGKKPAPRLLFNMVLHRQNIRTAREIWALLEAAFSEAIVNPYTMQLAFNREKGFFSLEELKLLDKLIDYCIERTINGSLFVKRLPYWLMLKAVFKTWGYEKWEEIAKAVSGYGLWTCYSEIGSWYLQIGRSGKDALFEIAGGQPSCFWDAEAAGTVTAQYQIKTPEQIVEYQFGGMNALARANQNACGGCGMPRLNSLNELNLLNGMNKRYLPAYFEARLEYMGY